MALWRDRYSVGQSVQAVFIMAHGSEWKSARVARKTRAGFPVVESSAFPGYALVIDRAAHIRPWEVP
jgi:hypothetical protein